VTACGLCNLQVSFRRRSQWRRLRNVSRVTQWKAFPPSTIKAFTPSTTQAFAPFYYQKPAHPLTILTFAPVYYQKPSHPFTIKSLRTRLLPKTFAPVNYPAFPPVYYQKPSHPSTIQTSDARRAAGLLLPSWVCVRVSACVHARVHVRPVIPSPLPLPTDIEAGMHTTPTTQAWASQPALS
jgi:hypothetical protein